jgi:uncharacterized membrane protein
MLGLTSLGIFHTAISLVAVGAGLIALIRDQKITLRNTVGRVYVAATVITCLTALGIFQHGGFGKPHMLAIITLVVLALSAWAGSSRLFGRASPYVETVGYSATFLFHLIPALAETTTRLPPGGPLFTSAEAPELQDATMVLLVLFLIGAALQSWRLHKEHAGA